MVTVLAVDEVAGSESPTTTTTTVEVPSEDDPAVSTDDADHLGAVLWFGVGAVAILAAMTVLFMYRRRMLDATFARVFALIVVAVLGVALAFSGVQTEALTAGFTLLGTVAGYLASAKTKETAPSPPPSPSNTTEGVGATPGPRQDQPNQTYL